MYTLQVKTSKMRYFRPFSLSLGCIAVVTSGYLPSTAETKEEAEKLLKLAKRTEKLCYPQGATFRIWPPIRR